MVNLAKHCFLLDSKFLLFLLSMKWKNEKKNQKILRNEVRKSLARLAPGAGVSNSNNPFETNTDPLRTSKKSRSLLTCSRIIIT